MSFYIIQLMGCEDMVRLCWISKKTWSNSIGGVPHVVNFLSLDELKETMKSCLYNGEWVEDDKGNRIDINLKDICVSQ